MPSISFKNDGISARLSNKPKLKTFLFSIFEKEGFGFKRISFIFCTDEAVLCLNRQFLAHDTFTDILTFTLSEKAMPIIAEIYISIERVTENAEKFGVGYMHELYRVMIHGILHLCGFSDHTPTLKAEMRNKENFYLDLFVSRETKYSTNSG